MFRRIFLSTIILAGFLMTQAIPHAMAATQCDSAQFVSDLTVPDGAAFAPGAAFTKTWRLMNNGTCTWTTSYNLVWVGGDLIGAPLSVKLPVNVPPGQMVDVSVGLIAPTTGGHYKGLWKISNSSGVQFGVGASASDAFWVDINVIEISAVIYDFVANAPYAQWKSGSGILPYPGTSGDSRGFSYQVNNPHLEDDSFDSSPGLLTVPQNKYNGTIQATYPEIQIQQGDKLQTLVNCEFGATGCYVTFRIDYLTSAGNQKTLWSWKEAYEGRFYRANIDLSPLAGQQVKIILMLLSSGSASGDRAIWGSPRIVRTGTVEPPAPPSTLTLLPPLTATATPFDQPPPTIAPYGCNKASFVADITVPDGTIFSPGAAFTKTWRLKNAGGCGWTTSYKFLFYSGEQMSAPTSINMPRNIAPGETVDLTVNMVAPASAGKYRGYWILSNASGTLFGIGKTASMPIWVEINVAGGTPTEMGYDFWANACSAQWKSGAGILPCPGVDGDSKGFMIISNFTKLEDGTIGPAPSLLMAPEYKYNGYIQGIYPTFTVQPGDHFRAVVGCEFDFSCYVTFRLDYMTATGSIKTFWTWREQNDGLNHTADLSLSPLAGQSVRFILTILATGNATGDRVRWTAPYIIRAPGPPATVTPAPPTITPTPIAVPGTVVPSPYIRKLFMLDSSNGWAIGDSYLLRTTDGGVTWYNITMPGVSSIENGFFPNSSKGWVLTNFSEVDPGSLYRTTDGGFTWAHYNVPFNNGYIQFLDDTHGFVLSILDSAMNKQSVALYQTSDGGATWVLNYVNDPTVPGAGTSLPLSGHKNGMTFRDTSHGWVGGDIPTNGFVYLYTTADNGVTWSQQPLALPSGYESAFVITTAPIFFDANDAVLPVWLSTNTSRDLFIYTSHNGGTTWTASSGFARKGENADFVSLNDGFSWDWANIFHVTNDSGNSWKQVTPNVDFSNDFRGMDFVSTTTGWVILGHANGYTSLYRTTDGGYTWTLLSTNLPTSTFTPTATPTPTPIANGWLTYTNSYYGFEFKVPPQAQITSQENNFTRIDLPFTAGTNLVEKYLEVIVAESTNPCQSPLAWQSMLQSSETITINGISFLKQTGEDGGMSHLHQWIAYSTLRDNACVSLDFILHSISPGVYPTPPPLFDYAAETGVFGDIVSTFAWLAPTATQTPSPIATVAPTVTSMAVVQSVEIQIVESQPLQVNAIVRGQLPDAGCTSINSVSQVLDGNTFRLTLMTTTDQLSPCAPVLTPFEQVVALDVSNLPPARYTVNANGIEQTFELVTRDLTKFEQVLVDALNAQNFDLLKVLMDQSFGFGFWQSQGTSYPADLAIEQLRTNYLSTTTHLTHDTSKDLNILLGGLDPYAIMGLDPAKSQALFVSGWGLDGRGEAILYVTTLPDGSLYWHGVLIAIGGFANP